MNEVRIGPSILSCDFLRLKEEIEAVDEAKADLIHIDVMDGHFVPNITIGPLFVEAIRGITKTPLDVHLMIEKPSRYIGAFIDAGADIVTVHAETDPHLHRTLDEIKSKNRTAGVSLNPSTPLDIIDYVLDMVDLVLIMTVNPGFGGQSFIPGMLKKIARTYDMIKGTGRSIDLEVDGGIKAHNAKEVVMAGANILVMGTEIFGSKNYKEKIREIRRELEGVSCGDRKAEDL
ncbi:MAG: ribulose-phosphate 3-epimerase [Syntrophorhabdaceae bacterium]|nr:ribulose-phosphate 3-epimerase [Syntrophorhabdaceae bacterium]